MHITLTVRALSALMGTVLLTSLVLSCSKDPEKIIARLEEKVREIPADGEDRKEAVDDILEEIDEYEKKENERRIQVLAEGTADGVFEISGDGRVFLFRAGSRKWTVLRETGKGSEKGESTITFSGGDQPRDVLLSFHGRYAIFSTKDDKQCRFSWIDLGPDLSSPEVKEDVLAGNCNTPIAPGEDGSIYYANGGDIIQRPMPNGPERLALAKSFFHPTFPKITNGLALIPVPDGLWILYGAGGYYDLYHYAGMPGIGRKVAQGIASPLFQVAVAGLFPEPEANDPRAALNAMTDLLFLFSGEAGRYRLQGFTLPGTPWKSFQIAVRRNIYYLKREQQFLYLKDASPVRFNPANGRETRLPIRARRVFVHQSGLIYQDEKARLLLRTDPYSDFEKKLFQIKEELEQNYR